MNLIIFVLAIYVGYHVVWNVTPRCIPADGRDQRHLGHHHRRRHAGRRADRGGLARGMGVFAVALAAVNVFGGFLVTRRMLEMFRRDRKPGKEDAQ